MSNFYLGQNPADVLGDNPRYFYALRRNENGSLFLLRSDQLKDDDTIELNTPGDQAENYTDFEIGVDFYEGIDVNHEKVFDNLKYDQYRWDDRGLFYYVDDDGQLVVKINRSVEYNNLDSED